MAAPGHERAQRRCVNGVHVRWPGATHRTGRAMSSTTGFSRCIYVHITAESSHVKAVVQSWATPIGEEPVIFVS